MTEQRLRDLVHDLADDLTSHDRVRPLRADRAWTSAARRRRRGRAAAVAGVAAASLAVATPVALLAGRGGDGSAPPATRSSGPTASATPTETPEPAPVGTRPDGRSAGWRVYWGPLLTQEARFGYADSGLPRTIDLSAPAPDLADEPIEAALASYVLSDAEGQRVLLLAPDGSLRSVDVSRVRPSGSGADVSVARTTLLSPSGKYLAFPQDGAVLVLTLANGAWRSVDTGAAVTTWLRWNGMDDLYLPSVDGGGRGPTYSVEGERNGAIKLAPLRSPGAGAGRYGRSRTGAGGTAQSWSGVRRLPVADNEITPSQVMTIEGFGDVAGAMLVFSVASLPDDSVRPEACCDVAFWLDTDAIVYESRGATHRLMAWRVGTHEFWRVAEVTGYDPAEQTVVSSYARIGD